jgi:RNA polymerase primary sigma factor
MKINYRSTLRPEQNRTAALNMVPGLVELESLSRLGRMEYPHRLPALSPLPVASKPELETEAPTPAQFEATPPDTAPSVLTIYLREIGQVKPLSREEEAALVLRIQNGDKAAREQLIKANLRLVVSIAHDFDGLGLHLLDLISEGNIGLMKAVDRFDPTKGARLSFYASFWIKQRMRLALSHYARTIRVPQHVYEKFQTIHAAAHRLQKLLGRDPTDDEIAQETGLPAFRVQRMREAAQPTISLDAPLNGSEEESMADTMPEENSTATEETFADSATVQHLLEFFRQLSPREQSILRSRFGWGCAEERTLEEVGRQFGLTRERVRQIQDSALLKLRKKFKAQKLLLLAARCDICSRSTPA